MGGRSLKDKRRTATEKAKHRLRSWEPVLTDGQNRGGLTATNRVSAQELKFRGMTSGLDKLKLRAGSQVPHNRTMAHLGHRIKQN